MLKANALYGGPILHKFLKCYQGSEGDAIEKLKQLERNSNSNSFKALSGKEAVDASKEHPSLVGIL